MNVEAATGIDILVIEDNPRDAELTVRAIRHCLSSNTVHVAPDCADALDFVFGRGAHEHRRGAPPPKVILLDLKLPRLGGLEVLDALKTDDRTRAIPVVVVTSSRQDADIRSAYAKGANSYVVKPVEFDTLMEAIGSIGTYWLSVNQPIR
jgi:two-component system, response regulator